MNRRRFLAALGGFAGGLAVGALLPKDDAPLTVKCAPPADGPFQPIPTRAPDPIAGSFISFIEMGPGLYRLDLPPLPPGWHLVTFNHPRP